MLTDSRNLYVFINQVADLSSMKRRQLINSDNLSVSISDVGYIVSIKASPFYKAIPTSEGRSIGVSVRGFNFVMQTRNLRASNRCNLPLC